MTAITLGTDTFTIEQLEQVARQRVPVEIAGEARSRVTRSRALVDTWVREGRPVYGVTTGFGALCGVAIPRPRNRA